MQTGLVSTIIPVHNRPQMLLEAVESVLTQTYHLTETIIVDDGSTDSTIEVAQELADRHATIKLITINNSGPGAAREVGRKTATGEYIQYLDSDDLLHKNKFERQVLGLRDNPSCEVSYCQQVFSHLDGTVISQTGMRSGEKHDAMFPAMLAGRIWGTPNPLYKKQLLDKAGPWSNLSSEEDWEYDCRIASLGVQLHYAREPLVTIRTHNQDHFGKVGQGEEYKIKERALAYSAIFKHAKTAEISSNCSEMQFFIRSVFSLSRTCAALGFIDEAKALFHIAKQSSASSNRKSEYRAFELGTQLMGWKAVGRLSKLIDRIRS